jgi:hypothetical protein
MRQPTAENVIANPVSSLGAPALAFLAAWKPCSACWMAWRTRPPRRGGEVVSTNEAVARDGRLESFASV